MKVFKLSKLHQPKIIVPPGKERAPQYLSKSQKLFEQLGLVSQCATGTFILNPIALRVMEKLQEIVKKELNSFGAQQVLMPSLLGEEQFRISGRNNLPELFKVIDRHEKTLILGPTHEEVVASHVASMRPSYKQLPIILYQISPKYRDEIKPRFGLLRSREFIMKDLYCFSSTADNALVLYNLVNESYHHIFKKLELPYCSVSGCTGEIGGSLSHEFHILTDVGEDKLEICKNCGIGKNLEIQDNLKPLGTCPVCLENTTVHNGIEVGHSFALGTRYTKPLGCRYISQDRKSILVEMSCHGIGLSRLLAAAVEASSTKDIIRWPRVIVPFEALFIPPKAGSLEEGLGACNIEEIASQSVGDVLIDDRTDLTVGKRLNEARAMGYPIIVVFGKSLAHATPQVEFHDTKTGFSEFIAVSDLIHVLSIKLKK